jgi:hypothetical protein
MQAALWAQALQDSSFAAAIRGGTYVYPFVNILHVLGVGLIVGSILALDFRILGFARSVSAEGASHLMTPFAITGLVIAIPSGFALYASDAVSLSQNNLMWTKLVLIALGIGNAILFRKLWNSHLADWERKATALARCQAMLSFLIWISVPVLGRLVAYF